MDGLTAILLVYPHLIFTMLPSGGIFFEIFDGHLICVNGHFGRRWMKFSQ
ncbi:hypothetical protein TR2A62_3288 [Thalassobium sp. R2A62]|nr:hypothetical protein TR2A62_3288 [Thalassobium sp. R2A62]